MTSLAVAKMACAISFALMFVSVGFAVWRVLREAEIEDEAPYVTRSEVQRMIDEAISRALVAKEAGKYDKPR